MGKLRGMGTPNWQQIEAQFLWLADLPAAEQKRQLEQLAQADPGLAREVAALLKEDADPHPLLASDTAQAWNLEQDARLTGSRVGAFTLERWIGAGGMGSVFEARRTDGEFDQRVAIKLIRPDQWSEQAMSLFRQERQILAQLQHPNIARLYDGGIREDGRPYFTMELVAGVSLTQYAQEHALPLRKRLELFCQVGEAVRYAHQQLIVHLDLKPTNILVEKNGGVKLLDFGVSRLLAEKSGQGSGKAKAFTLPYAAPELMLGEAVGTQADVYALGVILYELVTDAHPYAGQVASPKDLAEGFSPTAPSQEKRLRSQARARQLQGDIDAIVLKAMQKAPAQRYPSAEALLNDVRAYLEGYPVSVRGDTPFYRLRKYLARHRTAVRLSALFLSALLATGLFYTIELNRQRRVALAEADRAEQIKALTLDLFKQADPGEAQKSDITVREGLDERATGLAAALRGQPDILLEMYWVIGEAYLGMGLAARAEATFSKALALSDSLYERPHPRIAKALMHLGSVYGPYAYVRNDVSDSLMTLGYQILQAARQKDPELEAYALVELAGVAYEQQVYGRADSLFRLALGRYRQLPGDYRERVAYCLQMIGTTHRKLAQWEEAERYLLQAKAAYESLYQPPNDELAWNLNHLASLYLNKNEPQKAEPFAREAWLQRKQIYGEAHIETISSLGNLGRIYKRMERWEDALATYRDALASLKRAVGEAHPYVAAFMTSLAGAHLQLGQLQEAEVLYREAVAQQDSLLAPDDPRRTYALYELGVMLKEQGRSEQALPFLEKALSLFSRQPSERSLGKAPTAQALGECWLAMDRQEEAKPFLQMALKGYALDTVNHRKAYWKTRNLLNAIQ